MKGLWAIESARFYRNFNEVAILPVLIAIALALNVSHKDVQWLVAFFIIGNIVTKFILFSGVADFVSKRMLLIVFLCFNVLGALLSIIPHIQCLWFGRLFEGMGAGAITILSTVLIKEIADKDFLKIWAKINLVNTWAIGFGGVIGAIVAEYLHWEFIFLFNALISLLVMVAILVFVPKPQLININKKKPYVNIKKVLSNSNAVLAMLYSGCIFSGQIVIYVMSPIIFIHHFNWRPHAYSCVIFAISLSSFFASLLLNRYHNKLTSDKVRFGLIATTLLIGIGLIIICNVAVNEITAYLVLLLIFIYIMPVMIIITLVRHDIVEIFGKNSSSATSLLGIFQSLIVIIMTFIAIRFFHATAINLGKMFTIIGIAALFLYLLQIYIAKPK